MIKRASEVHELLKSGVHRRQKQYNRFRKTTGHGARKWFNTYLGKKGHHGDLVFDHTDKTLDMEVSMSITLHASCCLAWLSWLHLLKLLVIASRR